MTDLIITNYYIGAASREYSSGSSNVFTVLIKIDLFKTLSHMQSLMRSSHVFTNPWSKNICILIFLLFFSLIEKTCHDSYHPFWALLIQLEQNGIKQQMLWFFWWFIDSGFVNTCHELDIYRAFTRKPSNSLPKLLKNSDISGEKLTPPFKNNTEWLAAAM